MLELTDQLDMYVHILDSMIERSVLEVRCTALVADMDYIHGIYYCNNAFLHYILKKTAIVAVNCTH